MTLEDLFEVHIELALASSYFPGCTTTSENLLHPRGEVPCVWQATVFYCSTQRQLNNRNGSKQWATLSISLTVVKNVDNYMARNILSREQQSMLCSPQNAIILKCKLDLRTYLLGQKKKKKHCSRQLGGQWKQKFMSIKRGHGLSHPRLDVCGHVSILMRKKKCKSKYANGEHSLSF